ncbi:hypothetical protein [Rhodococcus sp. OAS809]|uniref:hypothetical protein n=1 Tax=Rhodococcus sp. OAS809 TaxID=2663874 RepID=UPI00178BA504
MTDIIDEIDALVDEQLSGYSQRTGYDYNASQDRCWHCGEDWHGLKITARMEEMRRAYQQESRRLEYLGEGETGYAESVIDPDYRYADDDSEVLCPGSGFIGPWATKRQIERMRAARILGDAPSRPYYRFNDGNPWTLDALRDVRSRYTFPQRYHLGVGPSGEPIRPIAPSRQLRIGDRVGFESSNGFRQEVVVVDVVESGFTTEYITEDPRFSARAQQLRDALDREHRLAREEATRGGEASQVIIDEGRPYRYGEDFSFADPAIPPEMQFPREWPDFASALRRILEMPNPFDPSAWNITVGDPEPDTRTPQERALPRPSTTPPMWAVDAGRQRRTRTNSRRRHR